MHRIQPTASGIACKVTISMLILRMRHCIVVREEGCIYVNSMYETLSLSGSKEVSMLILRMRHCIVVREEGYIYVNSTYETLSLSGRKELSMLILHMRHYRCQGGRSYLC